MQLQDWERLIKTLGVPTVMLAIIVLTLWKIVMWCRPYMEKSFEGHIKLVSACERTLMKLEQASIQADTRMQDLSDDHVECLNASERTAAALHHASHALDAIKPEDAVKTHTDQMRRVLEK